MIPLSSKVSFGKNILFREFEGEAVLLNIETGIYFGLNSTGAAMWHMLEKKRPLQTVLDQFLNEYDADEKECREDLNKFVTQLQKNGLAKILSE